MPAVLFQDTLRQSSQTGLQELVEKFFQPGKWGCNGALCSISLIVKSQRQKSVIAASNPARAAKRQ